MKAVSVVCCDMKAVSVVCCDMKTVSVACCETKAVCVVCCKMKAACVVCRLEENCGKAIKQQELGELEESFKSYKVRTTSTARAECRLVTGTSSRSILHPVGMNSEVVLDVCCKSQGKTNFAFLILTANAVGNVVSCLASCMISFYEHDVVPGQHPSFPSVF